MEVMNRFRVLDLIDRMPDELWREVHIIVQEVVTKTIPKGGGVEMKDGKVVV